jgi:HSP20 family molecular chaperone IbpA
MYSQFQSSSSSSRECEEPKPCSSKTARAQQEQQRQQQGQGQQGQCASGGSMDWTNLISSFLQGSPEANALVQNLASTFLGNLNQSGQNNAQGNPSTKAAAAAEDDVKSVSTNENIYEIKLDIANFSQDDILIRVENNWIYVEGKSEEKQDEFGIGFITRQFVRRFPLPEGVQLDKMYSEMQGNNILIISAPRIPASYFKETEKSIPIQVQ